MIKKIPFLIAKISANHCGNFNLAKKLIKCAKQSNAIAVNLSAEDPLKKNILKKLKIL